MTIVLAGRYVDMRMKKRLRNLETFKMLLTRLQSEINYSNDSIKSVIEKLSFDEIYKSLNFFSVIMQHLNEWSIKESWENAVDKAYFFDCLLKDDARVLKSYGRGLGISSIDGQNKNCQLHLNQIETKIESATYDYAYKGKMVRMMSFLIGFGVVIVMV